MIAVSQGNGNNINDMLFSGRRFVCRAGSDVCAVARAVFIQYPAGGTSGASVVEVDNPVESIKGDSDLIYVDDGAHMGLVKDTLNNLKNLANATVGVPFLFAPVFR